MKTLKNLQQFNEKQIKKQAEKQIKFLQQIYPFLNENTYHKECLEIRPIKRRAGNKFVKSLNLWRLDSKGIDTLYKFLNEINSNPFCIYYSGYVFDYNKICLDQEGKPFVKGLINNQNAIYTQILPMDFDNISEEEYKEEIKKLHDLGIETISIFTGHGYQDIILLDRKVFDTNLFKKFTYLLLSKGFKVDEKIIDPARVLRMPYTFNCKSYDIKSKYYNEDDPFPIPTTITNFTTKRYNPEDVFNKINSLETLDKSYIISFNLDLHNSSVLNEKEEGNTLVPPKPNLGEIQFTDIKNVYNMINYDALPDAIKNMLINTPENYRNSVLMFLVPFFRNKIGLPLETIIEVMKLWGLNCTPALDSGFVENEVKRIYRYNYKGTGAYTTELAKKFGYIEFDTFKLDNKIKIPNDFIYHFDVMNDGAVRIYLMMKLFEKIENIKEWTIVKICEAAQISKSTFYKNFDDLIKFGFIDKKRSARKLGEEYTYYINQYYDVSKGFTFYNTATIENMVYNKRRVLSNGEIKAYTFIYHMISLNNNNTCFASQKFIGEQIGKTRTSITKITDGLMSKQYINKFTYKDDKDVLHTTYTLNY